MLLKTILKTVLFATSFAFLFSCNNNQEKPNNQIPKDYGQVVKPVALMNDDSLILQLSKQVLASIKNKDYITFASFVHPKMGVRFSPYAFIDTARDLRFTADNLLVSYDKKKKLNWGDYSAGEI